MRQNIYNNLFPSSEWRRIRFLFLFLLFFVLFLPRFGFSSEGVTKSFPYGVGGNSGVTPNVLVIFDNSASMDCPAYWQNSDGSNRDCSGAPGTSYQDEQYDPATTYYGYFDAASMYSYSSNTFTIDTAGDWSGNFLNWASMRRIDVARKVLIGGKGLPAARSALGAPNTLVAESAVGNYQYIKRYPQASFSGLFPDCGTTADGYCYFGIDNGYIYLDNDSDPFTGYVSRNTLKITITSEWEQGVLQTVSSEVRLGLMLFNDNQGGRIDQPMADPPLNINYVNAIENIDATTESPLAEALYTAEGYFATDSTTGDNGPRYFSSPSSSYNTSGSNSDPYDFTVQNDVYCASSFVLLITDGVSTSDSNIPSTSFLGDTSSLTDYDNDGDDGGGNDYLDDVALWGHVTDLRSDLSETQNITLLTVYAFGSNGDILKNATVNGGFIDEDGDNLPTPAHPSDWNSYTPAVNELDSNADGLPDNYFEAAGAGSLRTAILSAFQQILALTNIVASPVVMPGAPGAGNNLYAATFLPQSSHQWKGHIIKYPLDSSGNLQGTAPNFTQTWDAGDILGDLCSGTCTAESDRNIFYANSAGSINNFTTSNWSSLMSLLGTNNTTVRSEFGYDSVTDPTYQLTTQKLINFVRGIDVFDEDVDGNSTEDRWKLADIYHALPIEVTTPPQTYDDATDNNYQSSFVAANANRPSTVYVAANDGMLHAFNSDTGVERWAFIPPMLMANLHTMSSATSNETDAKYFNDASPIVEDVYIDTDGDSLADTWKTVLVAGFRWGGRGYYVLDVTDPTAPLFMWGVSTDGTTVTYWDSSGTASDKTADADYMDYLKLGFTWSEPVTGRLKIDVAAVSTDKWVGVVGSGYRLLAPDVSSDLSDHATGVGRQMLVFQLDDGKILGKIDETTITDESGDGIDNSIPMTLSVISDKFNYMSYVYFADREGQLWKVNISGSSQSGTNTTVSDWSGCKFFDAQATYTDAATNPDNTNLAKNQANNRRYAYAQLEMTDDSNGNRWIYLGTGDIRNVSDLYPKIKTAGSADTLEGNVFVALRDDDPNPSLGTACASTLAFSDLTDVTNDTAVMATGAKGWYLHFSKWEKSFTPPVVFGKYVFFVSFVPDSTSICNIGHSYLYILDAYSGASIGSYMTGGKSVDLGTGVATGAVIRGGKIQIGVTGGGTSSDLSTISSLGGQRNGSIITLPLPSGISTENVKMVHWKETES